MSIDEKILIFMQIPKLNLKVSLIMKNKTCQKAISKMILSEKRKSYLIEKIKSN
jgi:hypothetical protein